MQALVRRLIVLILAVKSGFLSWNAFVQMGVLYYHFSSLRVLVSILAMLLMVFPLAGDLVQVLKGGLPTHMVYNDYKTASSRQQEKRQLKNTES
jgi:uncharacterized membrane protein